MKRMLILSLALLLAFTAPALAFNYARFAGLEGVTVDYDPENPPTSSRPAFPIQPTGHSSVVTW